MRTITLVQSHPGVSRSVLRTAAVALFSRRFRHAIVSAARENLPQQSAQSVWNTYAAKPKFMGPPPTYLAGFSYPESGGRWTDGYSAALTLPIVSAVVGRVQIQLTVTPLLCPGRNSSKFQICAGRGLSVEKTITIADEIPARILIEADVVSTIEFHGVIVGLNLLNPARPSDLNMSEDCRLLGLFVQDVEVRPYLGGT
jgi:hypothetical protein